MRLLGFLSFARRELPRLFPLMRDPGVPLWSKAAAVLAALLIVSPLNPFGDIPLLGLLDDAALLGLVVHLFVSYGLRHAASPVEKNVTPAARA